MPISLQQAANKAGVKPISLSDAAKKAGVSSTQPAASVAPAEPGLAEKLMGRLMTIKEANAPAKTPGRFAANLVGQNTLRTGGAVAGAIGDVIGAGLGFVGEKLWAHAPTKVKEGIVSGLQKAAQDPRVQTGLTALGQGADAYASFKKAHPDAALNLESAFNIATIIPGGEAGTLQKATSAGLKNASGSLEKSAAKKLTEEALSVVAPKLTKKEASAALSAGRGEVEKLGKLVVKPQTAEVEMARAVEGLVSPKKNAAQNIKSIRQGIADTGKTVEAELAKNDRIYNVARVRSFLSKAKDESKIIFGSDASKEKAYDAVVNEMVAQLEKRPKTRLGAWFARRDFDKVIEEKFPGLLGNPAGDTITRNAVKDVRSAMNDFIGDGIPEGTFKANLRKMTKMYEAVDNIAERAALDVDKNIVAKAARIIRANPAVSFLAGAGIMQPQLLSVLQNPKALSALAIYGTYRLGKKTLSSSAFKKSLAGTLEGLSKRIVGASGSRLIKLQAARKVFSDLLDHYNELDASSANSQPQQQKNMQLPQESAQK